MKIRSVFATLAFLLSTSAFAAGARLPMGGLSDSYPAPGTPVTIDVYKEPQEFGVDGQFALIATSDRILKIMNVSTGRPGRDTPSGTYGVVSAARKCGAIDGSTLDNCVFFIGGSYALHATPAFNYPKLGGKASAGCIRQTLPDSAWLLGLVQRVGSKNVVIRVHGVGAPQPPEHLHPLIHSELKKHRAFISTLRN